MKGVNYTDLLGWAVGAIIVFAVAFAFWEVIRNEAAVKGPRALDGVITGMVLYPLLNRAKKGMVITTSLLTSVVFITIVFFLILGIYFTLAAESGSSSSSFAFGIFDALIRRLPGVG